VPTLVLGGGDDVVVPPRHVSAPPALGAECAIVPGAPHDLMLDPRWPEAARAMLAWLARNGL
jgi:pimeloyl-ACP methyl ester carboxylesterase